jgi:hypothetical protein
MTFLRIFPSGKPNFPIFLGKLTSIFHKNKNLNQRLTFKMHVKAEKTASGSFFMTGATYTMSHLSKAALRPSNAVFWVAELLVKNCIEGIRLKKYGKIGKNATFFKVYCRLKLEYF